MIEMHAALAQRGLTFDLKHPQGRTLAVIGRNGTGKSSLIGLLSGLLVPDQGGSIMLDGQEVASPWIGPNKRPITLLSQDPTLFPHLSALDNVAYGLRAGGMSKGEARERARVHIGECGIGELADRKPHQMSGGQQQRVALARAIAVEPKILLLDEPLAAMDVAAAVQLRQLIKNALKGRTGVVVTHDMADISAFADDVAVLADGDVSDYGPVKDRLNDENSKLRKYFLGF
ncbi:ABC transporter ATP-binding protein [Flaviflexus massiliensis]|uniref:ABC transporter ATP-binding protein n=1 Tax=Flaviflexus massiliensis TaxID=1522309 RepID=UPI0006D5B5E6|nr:ATP-binding cassette domain-containing protein [Flaviflexus massiliensis]